MMWYHFIGWTKHMWQSYLAFNKKYKWWRCWCK